MIKHWLKLWCSRRYRCWKRGEHLYRRESRVVEMKGGGYRAVLSKYRVFRRRCTCCGHIRKVKSPEREFIESYQSVSMPEDMWETLRRLGYLPLTEWRPVRD